ncbi:DNA-protecting protein DprA [Saccharopolyspora rhizosphaerae]|uniref:DNA-protecting protein DprA n=1 Tax=Saccharopolyspora rhizosphaerae TaxID=2492662 RepID=A0A426JSZ7_9PSEU|nr:DNA-processing protein DprA [Saccharopolyspora rhizosphaerae]RRO16213.1 DNA-protecting protein DprA [Saccharopolyspora rhizosphaerae]
MGRWASLSEKSRQELLQARAFLAAVAEPPAQALARFVAERGARAAVDAILRKRAPAPVLAEVEARRGEVSGEQLLRAGDAAGLRLLIPEGPEWPAEAFAELAGAREVDLPDVAEPLALWVRGRAELAEVAEQAVGVVGARAASGYGEHVAAEFGHDLAQAGFTVVSGAAYGIDGAAHRGALSAGGRTVAFLACGADVDYPAGHSRLLRAIADQGVVVSEYPPGTPPRKHRFLVRNRLIAAMGQATVVVEAGARSGAANTANTADLLGRPVLAVPGPVTSQNSVGCHSMVRSGQAVLVTRAAEVVELLSPLGVHPAEAIAGRSRATDRLHPDARRVYDALTGMVSAADVELARDCGLPLKRVRAVLPELELDGFARRTEGGWSPVAT